MFLHVITEDRTSKYTGVDTKILQAIVDLGLADAADLEIADPDAITNGYPSGLT